MAHPQFRRLTPLVLLFALVQALVPALASVADAWRVDQRTPYAHIESETAGGCIVVHGHDCALCSVATSATGEQPNPTTLPPTCTSSQVAASDAAERPLSGAWRAASQRAPPGVRG